MSLASLLIRPVKTYKWSDSSYIRTRQNTVCQHAFVNTLTLTITTTRTRATVCDFRNISSYSRWSSLCPLEALVGGDWWSVELVMLFLLAWIWKVPFLCDAYVFYFYQCVCNKQPFEWLKKCMNICFDYFYDTVLYYFNCNITCLLRVVEGKILGFLGCLPFFCGVNLLKTLNIR